MSSSDLDKGDESSKKNYYTVVVEVKGGRHFTLPNMKSIIRVQVGEHYKWTEIREASPNPSYNQVFSFDFQKTFSSFLDLIIDISVFRPKKKMKRRKRLGSCRLDLANVWAQTDHHIQNRWFSITEPSDPTGEVRGYLKCSIKLIGKQIPKTEPSYEDLKVTKKHDIRGKMLVPEKYSMGKLKAKYTVEMYRAEGSTNLIQNKYGKLDAGVHLLKKNNFASFTRVIFCGLTAQTTVRTNAVNQTWNEELVFSETFPPLYDRMRISFHLNKRLYAIKYIRLSQISDPAIEGFLPTFGPTYMYFYKNEYEFLGAIVLSVSTNTVKSFKEKEKLLSVNRKLASPLMESLYWKMEEYVLFGVIFELSMIRKKRLRMRGNALTVSIHFGQAGYLKPPNEGKRTVTCPLHLQDIDDKYRIANLESNPVLYIKDKLPDNRHRLFNYNRIEKIVSCVELYMDKVKLIFDLEPDLEESHRVLNDGFRYIKRECSKDSITILPGITKLDKERVRAIRNKLNSISCRAELCLTTSISPKQKVVHMKCILEDLKIVMDNPQDSLPKVVIGVWKSNRLISYCCINAQDILHSVTNKEKGKSSGSVQTIILNDTVNKRFGGKLDIFLWLGVYSSIGYCLESLPSGIQDINSITDIPLHLKYETKSEYILRAFIFQGHLEPLRGSRGLCSSFVKVIAQSKSKKTVVSKKTLCPQWEETLVIPGLEVFGINSNSLPTIVTEVWNQINSNKSKLIGRFMSKPTVQHGMGKGYKPPSLSWYTVEGYKREKGEILAAFEIIEKSLVHEDDRDIKSKIPHYIKPPTDTFRLEVLFWGIRKRQSVNIDNPQIIINLGHEELQSEIIKQFSTYPNFEKNLVFLNIELPKEKSFSPPLVIRLFDNKHFGIFSYQGCVVVKNVRQFIREIFNATVKHKYLYDRQNLLQKQIKKGKTVDKKGKPKWHNSFSSGSETDSESSHHEPLIFKKDDTYDFSLTNEDENVSVTGNCCCFFRNLCFSNRRNRESSFDLLRQNDSREYDWWTKYNEFFQNSNFNLEDEHKSMKKRAKQEITPKIIVYPDELENQPQFNNFNDGLRTFEILPRKSKRRDKRTTKFQFKGAIALYELPDVGSVTKTGSDLQKGIFYQLSLNSLVETPVLIRVYVVRAHLLHLFKKDQIKPYIEIRTAKKIISDYKSTAPSSIDPIFGKVFELEGMLPYDSNLIIQLKSKQNQALIGETIIDVENRFYSQHRATCGLSNKYNSDGYNRWRDALKPSQILEELIQSNTMLEPVYKNSHLIVSNKKFSCRSNIEDKKECLALMALKQWHEVAMVGCNLVPEHVETRSLYRPNQPGFEHGKLEMWLDIFPLDRGLEIPPPVDISPRKPIEYELRVIIWKTTKVKKPNPEDTQGQNSIDLYVKGWLTGDDIQMTDVHYTTVKGEGLFNWRFVFPFSYIPTENMMVIKAKSTKSNEKELKTPPVLNLQVWDEEKWTANNYIGYIAMDLTEIPIELKRGLKNPLKNRCPRTINLFKQKKIRGQWPFLETLKIPHSRHKLMGILDAEINLLTQEEAQLNPAGKGRNEPLGLPKPIRPVMKMKFWLPPIKTVQLYLFNYYKKEILKCSFCTFIICFIIIFIYSFPVYLVKRIMSV